MQYAFPLRVLSYFYVISLRTPGIFKRIPATKPLTKITAANTNGIDKTGVHIAVCKPIAENKFKTNGCNK